MMPRVLVYLCLGLAGQCLADDDDDRVVRKPYGIAMCRQLCHEIVDCGVYMFSWSSLSCCIPLSSSGNCHDGISLLPDNKQIEANINLTSTGSCQQKVRRVILSRTKGRHCVEWKSEVHEKKKHLLGLPRLLLTPLRINTVTQFHQLQINTSIQEEYPFIQNPRRVRTIGYIPSLKRIVVDMELTPVLSSFAIDSSDQTILKKGLLTTAMCVDDQKQLVFVLVNIKPKLGIWRVPANGRNIGQSLIFRGKLFSSFSIDIQTERFYMFKGSGLYSSKYDGSDMALLRKPLSSRLSLFDDINRNLYYIKSYVLHKVSLSNNITSRLQPLKYPPAALVKYGGHIYISFYNTLQIGVLNLGTGNYEYLETVNVSWTAYALTFCILS
ncbi:uncharacterized protein LOC124271124 isoform X2 [Haliotis rubra]|nr:uncharacterized protein LOC124271124 isoform X2 [Haliotis rubra]XP_046562150.1 uncharacterized protein LOC124271124 isoform X2 [Haliotis rubra]